MGFSFIFKTASLVATMVATAKAHGKTVKLTHPAHSSAKVSLFGAKVVSFRPATDPTRETLYFSDDGGLSILFPNYNQREKLEVGGFARTTNWTCISNVKSLDIHSPSVATFTMLSTDATRTMWPFDFKLTYSVKLYANKLKTMLYVDNIFSEGITFEALFDNQLWANDVRNKGVRVTGLKGIGYVDGLDETYKIEDRKYIDFAAETNSMYVNVSSEVTAIIKGTNDVDRTVTIKAKGLITSADSTSRIKTNLDFSVWNPWEDSPAAEKGLDNFTQMFAIAPGRAIQLQLGQGYLLQQTISIREN